DLLQYQRQPPTGNRMMGDDWRIDSHRRVWVAVFILLTAALLAGGYGYYQSEAERIRQEKYHDIAAIAELKASQIQQWRRERLANARRASGSPFFRRALETWRAAPEDLDLR
ncbi:hypothetical protein RZS08_44005, partial [Arthrospira platensis SPKY1]|nr:hypothetical protein [Arthrospira platensis SPKY1]